MFRNVPLLDFTIPEQRARIAEAIKRFQDQLRLKGGIVATPRIADISIQHGEEVRVVDPSDPSLTLGTVHYATPDMVDQAVAVAQEGYREWNSLSGSKRAACLKRAAAILRERREDLIALLIHEAGKPWREADLDIVEAIDFCEYYAEQIIGLNTPRLTQSVAGEMSHLVHEGKGVCVVISPWNFPLAITCGMTVAALVCGNAVILKPAEQTSLIAHTLVEILFEAGVPRNALIFMPGRGEIIGRSLVEHRAVNLIVFTGSRAVGLEIIEHAAKTPAGQTHVKKAITEMGGKNAIIVDEDADLDEAVRGILYSAFGYAGQKCSACSRVIAVGDVYETMLERFCDAAGDLLVGSPHDSATFLGPLIDGEAQKRVIATIAEAKRSCKLAFEGTTPKRGHYVPITIFRDVKPTDSLWRDEIFAPVLSCCQAQDFENALFLANDSCYALTGGLYSRSPASIARAQREFRVGNLYINRGCTGAVVERHPFGGHKLSGTGAKAGGAEYLLQFLDSRTITENTMRRGFTPESC